MRYKDKLKRTYLKFLRVLPIQKRAIFCHNFFGRGYDENPRAIVEELLSSSNKYKIYWALKRRNANTPLPDGVEPVIIGSLKFYRIVATSKIWVGNIRLPEYFVKRRSQYYIQTWHGDLGFKKIEYDALDKLDESYKRSMVNDNKMIDLMTSGSNFFTHICRSAFKYDGDVLQCGMPKNDSILRQDHSTQKEILKKALKIKEDNILLYMPTFRVDYSHAPYSINLDGVKEALEKSTNSTWKILCKMHPNVAEENKKINCSDYISLDDYNNTQQAIVACDILITDYSSVAFDALLANRVVFSYINDEELYAKNERGLYFKFTELPFPHFKDSESLIAYIKRGNLAKATAKYGSFIKEQGVDLTGTASKKIAAIIERQCSKAH